MKKRHCAVFSFLQIQTILHHRFLQELSRAELRLYGRLDLYLLARLWVDAHALRPLRNLKVAKAGDFHILTFHHRFRNDVKDSVNDFHALFFALKAARGRERLR